MKLQIKGTPVYYSPLEETDTLAWQKDGQKDHVESYGVA